MATTVPQTKYSTSYRMNKFEFAQIFRTRSKQISQGAPSTIDSKGIIDPLEIAYNEFKAGKVPLRVTRIKPNGSREIINTNILDASEFIDYTDEFEKKRENENYCDLFYK